MSGVRIEKTCRNVGDSHGLIAYRGSGTTSFAAYHTTAVASVEISCRWQRPRYATSKTPPRADGAIVVQTTRQLSAALADAQRPRYRGVPQRMAAGNARCDRCRGSGTRLWLPAGDHPRGLRNVARDADARLRQHTQRQYVHTSVSRSHPVAANTAPMAPGQRRRPYFGQTLP